MILNKQVFKVLLEQLDCDKASNNSTLNHHVDGLDYLCLHRSDELTVKLYLMEKPKNPNSGYLVNPHSHRYSFSSLVLCGQVEHLRFKETPSGMCSGIWEEHTYSPETKAMKHEALYVGIQLDDMRTHFQGSSYFVKDDEVHTLRMTEGSDPFLLGLVQFRDTKDVSKLYTPIGHELVYPNSITPTIKETEALRKRCLQLLN